MVLKNSAGILYGSCGRTHSIPRKTKTRSSPRLIYKKRLKSIVTEESGSFFQIRSFQKILAATNIRTSVLFYILIGKFVQNLFSNILSKMIRFNDSFQFRIYIMWDCEFSCAQTICQNPKIERFYAVSRNYFYSFQLDVPICMKNFG